MMLLLRISRHPLVVTQVSQVGLIGLLLSLGVQPPVSVGTAFQDSLFIRFWGFGLFSGSAGVLIAVFGRWSSLDLSLRLERYAWLQFSASSALWVASILIYGGWASWAGALTIGALVVGSALRAVQIASELVMLGTVWEDSGGDGE